MFDKQPSQGLPIEQIKGMRAQGLTNNQIIQALQKDGFSSSQIFDAMNQADMSSAGATNHPIPQIHQAPQQQHMREDPSAFPFSNTTQSEAPRAHPAMTGDVGSSEELIEAIIDEKWNELVRDINKIIDWKTKTEANIAAMQQQFADLKDQYDKLHQAVVGKIGEYDKNILEVGAEIKAMEKVFSKVLPVFTENINELSRITGTMKRRR